MPIPQISDTIHLSDPNAGNANAGNGGDGYSFGDIHYSPTAYVANTQAVEGAYTDLHNGDHVWQMADWDAGGGGSGGLSQAQNGFLAAVTNNGDGGAGGSATSNGNQGAATGGDTAAVAADTTATQYTQLLADQHATILAGVIIGPNDLLIAAHALALDCVLVTDNVREFERVAGLAVENWLRT